MQKPKPPVRWTPHHDEYERASAVFSASYMSNAKWQKVLTAIAQADLKIEKALWKFIESDHLFDYGVPRQYDLLPTRFADGRFQPVEYKWIEWVHFPCHRHLIAGVGYTIPQDIEGLKQVLIGAGQFQYAEDEEGLTLYGYGK